MGAMPGSDGLVVRCQAGCVACASQPSQKERASHLPGMTWLLAPLAHLMDPLARAMLEGPGVPRFDFSQPKGAPALAPADGVSWQVFANPLALFIGGVAAVLLELALPAVRAGVWEHSDFRRDPVGRLRRTGLAAMVTVYGAAEGAEAMIAGVRRAHDRVSGHLPSGEAYRANDPELLRWVQATAVWGFTSAYDCYVAPLEAAAKTQAFAEGAPAARLYGVTNPPVSWNEWERLLGETEPSLEPSAILREFLGLMRYAPVLPRPLQPLQRLMVRGAVDLVPMRLRARLELGPRDGVRGPGAALLRALGTVAERIELPSAPSVRARQRLGFNCHAIDHSDCRG